MPFGCPRLLRSEKTAGAAQSVGATSATAVLGVAILAKHIEQCVNLKYGNTAHARYAKTLPLLQATKRALGSAAALPLRCTACAAATRARTAARARNGILFFGKCSLSVQEHFCKFCQWDLQKRPRSKALRCARFFATLLGIYFELVVTVPGLRIVEIVKWPP